MKNLQTEIELTNAQIQGLNEKLAESADNSSRQQGIMQQVHSLSEGRTAIRVLITKVSLFHHLSSTGFEKFWHMSEKCMKELL